MKIILSFVLVTLTPLVMVDTTVTAIRFLADDEPKTLCENETEAITESANYTALKDIIDEDIMSILNNSRPGENLCAAEKRDGFTVCTGELSPIAVSSYEAYCSSVGQLLTLKNVRVTCSPEENKTFTRIKTIPLCVGTSCSKDEGKVAISDELKSLGKMGVELNGSPGSCKALQGSSAFSYGTTVTSLFMVVSLATSWLLL
jgi:hypothetical protein